MQAWMRRVAQSRSIICPTVVQSAKKKNNISPKGRKRIAEAVKKPWEAQKKQLVRYLCALIVFAVRNDI
jgi:hypothetical protein